MLHFKFSISSHIVVHIIYIVDMSTAQGPGKATITRRHIVNINVLPQKVDPQRGSNALAPWPQAQNRHRHSAVYTVQFEPHARNEAPKWPRLHSSYRPTRPKHAPERRCSHSTFQAPYACICPKEAPKRVRCGVETNFEPHAQNRHRGGAV